MDQLTPSEINKLANNYQNGIGIEKDECKTFELYLKADEMGNTEGTFNVGICYYYGIGVERDFRKAFVYYQKSAEMGDAAGTCNIGYSYCYGIGVETNKRKEHIYYQKAAKMGDIFAFGACYCNGIGVVKDKKKAFEYFLKSAEMGNVKRIKETGSCYHYGTGVEKNRYKAFKYYQKCVDMGDALGANSAGVCYASGVGVKENKYRALEYYKKSTDMGLAMGTYNMVIKDECKAFEYYKKSAEMGYARGIYRVGEFYQKGLTIEKSIDIVFEWYLKSAITGQCPSKGAFSAVFKTKYLNNSGSYEEVAIKLLKACHSLNQYLGISRDAKTKDYILVLSYAKYGSLSKNLANILKFKWKIKLKILHNIISNLDHIHSNKYLHQDIHSGNILLKEDYEAYITDLGLSKPLDEKEQDDPSDIYSFGIIKVEITTGQRPFNYYKFDKDLIIEICEGLRPKFGPGIPDCYIELANQCMDSDPGKRPISSEIIIKLNEWLNSTSASLVELK
ncbi:kinase-like domain-containing protein [Gigaspora rosea]|uniref:Kinase-like domain-containing protein n=1 Tax=Gigaspora rosea TaxID=44941 RepID=A0A397U6B2_9GLOM|nr:kinase-like domain-containing protein [Gigaspora rosea]